MELHPLLPGRGVHAQHRRLQHDGGGIDADIAVVAVEGHAAPDGEPVAHMDLVQNGHVVLAAEEFRDGNAAGVVGDGEAQHGGVVLADLAAGDLEDLAGDGDGAGFQGHVPDGDAALAFGQLAQQRRARAHLLFFLFFLLFGGRFPGIIGADKNVAQTELPRDGAFQAGELARLRPGGEHRVDLHGHILPGDQNVLYPGVLKAAAQLLKRRAAAEHLQKTG